MSPPGVITLFSFVWSLTSKMLGKWLNATYRRFQVIRYRPRNPFKISRDILYIALYKLLNGLEKDLIELEFHTSLPPSQGWRAESRLIFLLASPYLWLFQIARKTHKYPEGSHHMFRRVLYTFIINEATVWAEKVQCNLDHTYRLSYLPPGRAWSSRPTCILEVGMILNLIGTIVRDYNWMLCVSRELVVFR